MRSVGNIEVVCPACSQALGGKVHVEAIGLGDEHIWVDLYQVSLKHKCEKVT